MRSPVAGLLSACPGLSKEHAGKVLSHLDLSAPQTITIASVLQSFDPDGPWQQEPSAVHAARWLLWLEDKNPPEYIRPVLAHQAFYWESRCSGPEKIAYTAIEAETAHSFLLLWMGLAKPEKELHLDVFPVPIPERWLLQAREQWRLEIAQSGGSNIEKVLTQSFSQPLRQTAAEVLYGYYLHHPDELEEHSIRLLDPYLSDSQVKRLRVILPPAEPEALPETYPAVLAWFRNSYLPYRRWEAEYGEESAHRKVEEAALSFAEWFLNYYAKALASAKGRDALVMFQSDSLRKPRGRIVTLWIVLDGLHYADARSLVRLIEQDMSHRLTLQAERLLFAPIPTITRFCKPSLLYGKSPDKAIGEDKNCPPGVRELAESKDPAPTLSLAREGDLFLWSLSEPDKTYHKRHDRATIIRNVEGQLHTIADKIVQAAEAVSSHLPLKVIISTDHGRLLGRGTRQHPVPEGMEVHGRTGWGTSRQAFPSSGVIQEGGVAYLYGKRFGLPEDCAIILTSDVFITNDGKTGSEEYPHGGLYPEEVIVPWIELVRDQLKPKIKCTLSGKGRARKQGSLRIELVNPSELRIRAVSLDLGLEMTAITLDILIEPFSASQYEGLIPKWPDQQQLKKIKAIVLLELPGGEQYQCGVESRLVSEELYSRENILEDL